MLELEKKLLFNNEEEKKEFNKYLVIKGEYLYLDVYNILKTWHNQDVIAYYEISSVIRYDKSLRNVIYKYLAFIEEYFRAYLCRNFDYESNKKWRDNLQKKSNFQTSKLYKSICTISLENLNQLLVKYCNYDETKLDDISKLRNLVMHHQLLLIGKQTSIAGLKKNIIKIQKYLNSLYDLLIEEYRDGFQKEINACNYGQDNKPKYLTTICLGVMKNGICK